MNNFVSEAYAQNQYGLITRERAEKFDLLGQLILGQAESIVVCGAEGIGKTRFFNTFKKERENIWAICLLQGREILSFEQIKTMLVLTILQRNTELVSRDLEFLLSFCEQKQQKLVLIIDDAINLASGLITTLTEYALHNPILRLVFAFTKEQLYQKNLTDRAVDDCYFIEIPALTQPQIAVFLQDQSVFPNAESDIQKIDNKLLNKLYQRSGGIPGKIVTDFPLLIEQAGKNSSTALKSLLISSLALMAAGLVYFNSPNHDNNSAKTQPVSATLPVKAAIKPNLHAVVKRDVVNVSISSQKQPEPNKASVPEVNNQVIQPNADEQWILQQATDQYTLQLMASSKPQALVNIVKKHHNLETALKILQVKNKNQETYLLLYGAYPDNKTAYAAVNSLPAEFRQAWPRKIDTLQQEIKTRTISLPNPKQLPLKQ